MVNYEELSKSELIRKLKVLEENRDRHENEAEELLHDLQVHQIELEMQNRELNESQAALEASRDRYAELYDFAPVGYASLDHAGMIQQANLTMATMLGIERGKLEGKALSSYVCDSRVFFRHLSQCRESSLPLTLELILKCRGGGQVTVQMVSMHVQQDEGAGMIRSSFIDISELKRLDTTAYTLSQAVKHSGGSILITDQDGIIEYVNPTFTKITGFTADEVIGKTPRILKSSNQDDAFYAGMWKMITSGHTWHGKLIDKRKDGSLFPAIVSIAPIFDREGAITHFVASHTDISELENLQQQFQQAQKMEAIGTLVGGIAHDFNNMLAGITANIYLASKQVQTQSDVVQRLDNIEALSLRAADMIQQLLTFSRKGMISMKALPMTPFIKETMKFLHTSVPENIDMREDICSESLQIKGDSTQIHQVLMNLINNARDALEGVNEPSITVRLEPFYPDDVFLEKHSDFEMHPYAHLSVNDNGCGIPEHQLEHLFEPFFTTKEQGKGTGLGLAMVYGAVKTHHGFVDVDSIEGKGSTFNIYMPLLDMGVLAVNSEKKMEAIEGQGELILLADDEQIVRETMAEILESLGYKVLQAKNGLEAVELFDKRQQDIALAILDVVMPKCSGVKAARHIKAMNPNMPIMFLTGYDKEHVLDGEASMSGMEALIKPVNFNQLSRSIRHMLD